MWHFLSISYQKWEFLLRHSLFNCKNENFEDIQTQPRPFQYRIDWAWHFRFENILTQKKFYLGKILYQKFNFSKSKRLRLKIYFELKGFKNQKQVLQNHHFCTFSITRFSNVYRRGDIDTLRYATTRLFAVIRG